MVCDIPVERVDSLFDEVYAVNVKSYALTARISFDLVAAEEGALVLTCSQAAFAADGGGTVGTASMGAVRSLLQQLAFELAPLQHVPAPEEYGPVYALLASRHNRIITGQTVVADSGTLDRALMSTRQLLDTMPTAQPPACPCLDPTPPDPSRRGALSGT